jgi:hypothetical protein
VDEGWGAVLQAPKDAASANVRIERFIGCSFDGDGGLEPARHTTKEGAHRPAAPKSM